MATDSDQNDEDPYALPYVVLFRRSTTGPAPKVVFTPRGRYPEGVTWPQSLDRDITSEVLDAIWYCLHLPRTLFDTMESSAEEVRRSARLDHPHDVMLIPIDVLREATHSDFVRSLRPVLVLFPDAEGAAAGLLTTRLVAPTSPTQFSSLTPSMLAQHWKAIAMLPVPKSRSRTLDPPPWTPRSLVAPLLLPTALYTQRAVLREGVYPDEIGDDVGKARRFSIYQREWIEALAVVTSQAEPQTSKDELRSRIDAAKLEVAGKGTMAGRPRDGGCFTLISKRLPLYGCRVRRSARGTRSSDDRHASCVRFQWAGNSPSRGR